MYTHAHHTTCMEIREQPDHMSLETKLSSHQALGSRTLVKALSGTDYEQTLELKLSHLCQCPSTNT